MKNKIEYSLHIAGPAERVLRQHLLLEGVYCQKWYEAIEFLKLWRGPGLICIQ